MIFILFGLVINTEDIVLREIKQSQKEKEKRVPPSSPIYHTSVTSILFLLVQLCPQSNAHFFQWEKFGKKGDRSDCLYPPKPLLFSQKDVEADIAILKEGPQGSWKALAYSLEIDTKGLLWPRALAPEGSGRSCPLPFCGAIMPPRCHAKHSRDCTALQVEAGLWCAST